MVTLAKFKVGDRCRCLHQYAFRGKEPFVIVSIATSPDEEYERRFRYIYVIQYDDGAIDAIPVGNEGGYNMERIAGKEAT